MRIAYVQKWVLFRTRRMHDIVGASLSTRVHMQNMEQLRVDRVYMSVIRMCLGIEQPLATVYEQNI